MIPAYGGTANRNRSLVRLVLAWSSNSFVDGCLTAASFMVSGTTKKNPLHFQLVARNALAYDQILIIYEYIHN